MDAEKLSQVRAWAKGKSTIDGVTDPYDVEIRQMAAGWAKEAQGYHSDTIEHRARIDNLTRGVKDLVEELDERDAAINGLAGLLLKAYAPLRNVHVKEKGHRDVVANSTGTGNYCFTCDTLRQMQEAIEKATGRELVAYFNGRKAGAR